MKDKLTTALAGLGLPDDIVEEPLAQEERPSAAALARIKRLTLVKAGLASSMAAPLPASDENRSTLGSAAACRPRRSVFWTTAAGVALLAVTAVATVGPERVLASMERALSYVPGFGTKLTDGDWLAAPGPVRVSQDGAWLEVRGVVADAEQITVHLYGEGLSLYGAQMEVNGHPVSDAAIRWMGSERAAQAWITVPTAIPTRARSVSVTVKEARLWRLSVPVLPGAQLTQADHFGPSVTHHGYTVAAQVHAGQAGTHVNLLVWGAPNGSKADLMAGPDTMPVLSVAGTGWQEHIGPTISTPGEVWYLHGGPLPDGVSTASLTLPAIVHREAGEATVALPVQAGALHREVQIGRWAFRLSHTDWDGETMRIYFDMGQVGQTYLRSVHTTVGDNLDHRGELSDVTGQLQWLEFTPPPGEQVVTLRFAEPAVGTRGPWLLEVPVHW